MKNIATLLLCLLALACGTQDAPQPLFQATAQQPIAVEFTKQVIDANASGDVKAAADIDGDAMPDLIVGGLGPDTLNWYHYPSWTKTTIAAPLVEFTTDGAAGDVDGDGDQDIVVPDGSGTNNLVWFQNPAAGGGDPFNAGAWSRRVIGTIGSYGKDVELGDFDQDGRLDVATRTSSQAMIFFQDLAGWTKATIPVTRLGIEGMASGDINADGKLDLVFRGSWLRNPGGQFSRSNVPGCDTWSEYEIGSTIDQEFKALVFQADADAPIEVAFSSSENTADVVVWHQGAGGPTAGTWSNNLVAGSLPHVHTLQAADFDQDGDNDLVIGQMHTASPHELAVWFNNGAGSWTKTVVDSASGLHNGIVLDVGNDGFFDIYGANWTGNPPLHLWRSHAVAADTTPPTIGAVASSGVSNSSAVVTWTTDEPASTRVEYGSSTAYGASSSLNPSLVLSHSVTLGGLSPNTLYHFRVVSADASGNPSSSDDFTFETTSAPPPPSSLLAWWKCDDGSGSTVADASGNGRAGAAQGMAWGTGQHGGACSFSGGTSSYVAVPTFNVTGSAITITGWANIAAFTSAHDQRLVSKANGSQANNHDWMVSETDSGGRKLRFRLKTGTTTSTLIAGSGTLTPNTWFHFAATYDGAQMCLWKDGTQVGCTAKTGSLAQSSSAINLARNPDASNPLNGRLDDVRVYSKALTSSEIANDLAGL